ncbi:MAG: heme lyase CcmF/NrfE family subunit [Burkholderiales bacterium]|nr:heme lyase CcmF/NrfE family subunit [Burkholderiales bacterium]
MIVELGHLSLIIAMLIAVAGAAAALIGAARGERTLIGFARPAAQAQCLFIVLAFLALVHAFATNDFSVKAVAMHSNSALPVACRIAGIWGGHEGSMLLWALILGLWTLGVSVFSRTLPDLLVARVLGVMGLVTVGFCAYILFVSSPFERLLPAAADGRDLNPLLQDPGMVLHPPLLYMGYVGFSVAFAFSVAALLGGRLDAPWARWSRPWTTVAWCFLTLGIALGSFWAYYELGWGGWWFWDPVENASFMPWLVGTALIHSLAVTEKRGAFRAWTALLAICAFSLSLLGTFLVRSGVLTSVHAFATDPRRGLFILGLLAIVVGGSLALFAARGSGMRSTGTWSAVSRDSFLLANNVMLVAATACVLLGTLYPLMLDALGLGKISVGPPYFEAVFTPLAAPLVALIALGMVARWRDDTLARVVGSLRWAAAFAVLCAVAVPYAMGRLAPLPALGFLLAAWVAGSVVVALATRLRRPEGAWAAFAAQPRAFHGMLIAHTGVAVFIVGVTMVKSYEVEKDLRMRVGDVADLGRYSVRLDRLAQVEGPNYIALRGTFTLMTDGRATGVLEPEKRVYRVQRMPMTEAAIDRGFAGDTYIAMGERVGEDAWAIRLQRKPFVNGIWFGCLLMAVGGALAATDRRYRVRASTAAPAATGLRAAADGAGP